MALCVLCASLLGVNHSNTRFTTGDEARSHAGQHLSQTNHFDNENSNSLDQVFERCFPNFIASPLKQKKKIVVKKEGRQTLLNVCHAVFKGRISKASPRATCLKCGSGMVLYGEKSRCQFGVAIDHASSHLGIDLFECRQCGRTFRGRNSVRCHLVSSHGLRCRLPEYFTDKSGDFIDEISNSIEQCFSEGNNSGPTVEKAPKIGRQSVLNICHTVFKGRISKDSPRVTCHKCRSEIILYGKKKAALQFGIAIGHASAHLGLDLFDCRKCTRSFTSKYALCNHLRRTHQLRVLSEYFTDKSGDFIDEIINSIEQCFAEDSNSGPSDEKAPIIRLKEEAGVRYSIKGSKLAIERQLFCYRLIRQLVGDDGTAQCRQCPKRIGIKRGSNYKGKCAMEHARVHLKKPVFRCKVCSNVRHTLHAMQFHLKSAHALPSFMNYDCLEDQFHAEVLDMLRKCYGEEPGK